MSLAKIRIEAVDVDPRVIEVNGEDVSNLVRAVHMSVGTPGEGFPVVQLVLARPDVTFEGEGVVQVVANGPSVAEWLATVDRQQLEATALERAGWGHSNMTELVIEVLQEWAAGG